MYSAVCIQLKNMLCEYEQVSCSQIFDCKEFTFFLSLKAHLIFIAQGKFITDKTCLSSNSFFRPVRHSTSNFPEV